MVKKSDTVICDLSNDEIKECILTSLKLIDSIVDREDLHERSYLERFIDLVLGEISEKIVIKWIQQNGKYAESAVDKQSQKPDMGHDIWLKDRKGVKIRCSVKSSLSALKSDINEILCQFKIASKKSEIRDVNVQVYFWLKIHSNPRTTVPSNTNVAIIGWAGRNDIKNCSENAYATEQRREVQLNLKNLRPMKELLQYIT